MEMEETLKTPLRRAAFTVILKGFPLRKSFQITSERTSKTKAPDIWGFFYLRLVSTI